MMPPLLATPVEGSLRQCRANQVAGDQRVATHQLRHAGGDYRLLRNDCGRGLTEAQSGCTEQNGQRRAERRERWSWGVLTPPVWRDTGWCWSP